MTASTQLTASQEFEQRDMDRCWNLYHAFQFGQDAAREADATAINAEFAATFGGDAEAIAQYEAGFVFERSLPSPISAPATSLGN